MLLLFCLLTHFVFQASIFLFAFILNNMFICRGMSCAHGGQGEHLTPWNRSHAWLGVTKWCGNWIQSSWRAVSTFNRWAISLTSHYWFLKSALSSPSSTPHLNLFFFNPKSSRFHHLDIVIQVLCTQRVSPMLSYNSSLSHLPLYRTMFSKTTENNALNPSYSLLGFLSMPQSLQLAKVH